MQVEGFLRGVEEERDVDFFAAGLDFLAAADEAGFSRDLFFFNRFFCLNRHKRQLRLTLDFNFKRLRGS